MVGAVFQLKDPDKSYRKVLENAIKGLTPDIKNIVVKLLNSVRFEFERRVEQDFGPGEYRKVIEKY